MKDGFLIRRSWVRIPSGVFSRLSGSFGADDFSENWLNLFSRVCWVSVRFQAFD